MKTTLLILMAVVMVGCGKPSIVYDDAKELKLPKNATGLWSVTKDSRGNRQVTAVKTPVSKPKPASAPKYSSRIIKCHDCRGIVSKTAASCPHCGSTDYIGHYYPASKWPKKITVRDPDETEPR